MLFSFWWGGRQSRYVCIGNFLCFTEAKGEVCTSRNKWLGNEPTRQDRAFSVEMISVVFILTFSKWLFKREIP